MSSGLPNKYACGEATGVCLAMCGHISRIHHLLQLCDHGSVSPVFRKQFYCNSMEAALFAADTPAASSGSASQQNSSSSSQQTFPPISSSVSSSAQLSPDFLATVVQAVKAEFAAKQAPVAYSHIVPVSAEDDIQLSVAVSESSLLLANQALGSQTSSLLGFGSSLLPWHSSSLPASSQPGRPAIVVPTFDFSASQMQ